jgi:eukaryotic-like serine/threonine-protein kinase
MDLEGLSLPAIGDIVAEKYRVERILGAGGMGVVLLGTHTTVGNKVALKFLKSASASPLETERFLREARAAGRLTSEHVARVYDAGTLLDGTPYIAMEFIEGGDLSKRLEDPTEILVPDAVEYVLQATEGLIDAHAAGIVHRDLKPQNLVLGRRVNGLPLVKILDFGIAKAIGWADQQLTVSHAVMGSPLYMSPEQMRGIEVDERCDQWAIGVILYELLARRLPYNARTFPELVLKVTLEEPIPLAELAPHVPPELADVVMRCLRKEREERFLNIGQLAASLEPFARSTGRGLVGSAWDSSRNAQLTESGAARLQVPRSAPQASSVRPQAPASHAPSFRGGDVSHAAVARTFPPEEPTLKDLPPEHSTLSAAPPSEVLNTGQKRILRKRHVFAMSLPGGILVGAVVAYALANKSPGITALPNTSLGKQETLVASGSSSAQRVPSSDTTNVHTSPEASHPAPNPAANANGGASIGASIGASAGLGAGQKTVPSAGSSKATPKASTTGAPTTAPTGTNGPGAPTSVPRVGPNGAPILE